MSQMTTKERFIRMYEHREADRVPIFDSPWAGTVARWIREGMPEGADWRDYFGVDKVASIGVDITPRYEYQPLHHLHFPLGRHHETIQGCRLYPGVPGFHRYDPRSLGKGQAADDR